MKRLPFNKQQCLMILIWDACDDYNNLRPQAEAKDMNIGTEDYANICEDEWEVLRDTYSTPSYLGALNLAIKDLKDYVTLFESNPTELLTYLKPS